MSIQAPTTARGHRREFERIAGQASPLEALYYDRYNKGRDLKVIITQRNSETGGGKSTLAVQLAKKWDQHGWTAERATLDPGEYEDLYLDVPSNSALILDEAEQAADSRRSMSNENVKLSHLWATMRYREVYTIVTLPTQSMLDKRLKELADVRINVIRRGLANVYYILIDDHDNGTVMEKKIEQITWGDLDDDPDYQTLSEKKAERMSQRGPDNEEEEDDTPSPDEIRHEYRNQLIKDFADVSSVTYAEISEAVGLDESTISRIVNDKR